jgi:hypothetical protein
MFLWINEVLKAYPHLENKDIRMVLNIKKPTVYEQSASFNWHWVVVKKYLKDDIEEIFGKITKD